MQTVAQLATTASGQLNDQYVGREFTRWTRAQLVSYLNMGVAEISGLKPDEFTKHEQITLVEGARQKLASPQRLIGLESNTDGTGITQADVELMRAFGPYTCCAAEVVLDKQGRPVYRVKSYGIDQKATDTFYVDPPVPVGMSDVKVNAVIYAPKVDYSLDEWDEVVDVPDKYIPALIDYMQARAHDIDQESPMAKRNAQDFFRRFYNTMGVKYRAEAAHRAGNINGAVGTGDPRARIA